MWIWIGGLYALMSFVTFMAYGLDKRAARRGRPRTRESTLHLLALLGGWPGALLAQLAFRHKTIKLGFRLVLWCIIALHLAGWAVLLWLRQR